MRRVGILAAAGESAAPAIIADRQFAASQDATGLTVTRAHTGGDRGRWNNSGLFDSIAANTARFTWTPDGVTSLGLLVEGAETTVFQRSANLPTSPWSGNGDLTETVVTSAFNSGTARRYEATVFDPAPKNGSYSAFTGDGSVYYMEFIIEQETAPAFSWGFYSSGWLAGAKFTSGDVCSVDFGTGTCRTRQLRASGPNGGELWYVSLERAFSVSMTTLWYPVGYDNTPVSSNIVHYGGMTRNQYLRTPIITTTATGAVGSDDVTTTLGQAAASTSVAGRTPRVNPGNDHLLYRLQSDTNNYVEIRRTSGNAVQARMVSGGVEQSNIALGTIADDTDLEVAMAWDATSGLRASIDGGAATADAGTLPSGSLTSERIGSTGTASHWDSTIARVRTWDGALSDAALATASAGGTP